MTDAYFQPEAQAYPTVGGGSAFPDSTGQAVSVPDAQNNVRPLISRLDGD
jgi:hypothetical protein